MKPIKFQGHIYDVSQMTDDELRDLRLDIEQENQKLKIELQNTTEQADSNWYQRATNAKYHLSRSLQIIQNEFGRRKAVRRETMSERSLSDYFVDVARDLLPIDVFERLYAVAQSRKQKANDKGTGKDETR